MTLKEYLESIDYDGKKYKAITIWYNDTVIVTGCATWDYKSKDSKSYVERYITLNDIFNACFEQDCQEFPDDKDKSILNLMIYDKSEEIENGIHLKIVVHGSDEYNNA